jgi:hypothetical protein
MKIVVALLFVAINAFAIPQLINYQGQLTSPTGSPLDTTVAMTFRLYPVSSGGATVWTETHPAVTVTDGLFNVSLGSITALSDLFAVNRWLGVTIGNNSEMTPRQQVTTVAHAYRVGTIDGASGGYVTSSVQVYGDLSVGDANTISQTNSIAVGTDQVIEGQLSSITGGSDNIVNNTASWSHIGGGNSNSTTGHYTTIGGGSTNISADSGATVSGGRNNRARGRYSVVAGGGGGFELGNRPLFYSRGR